MNKLEDKTMNKNKLMAFIKNYKKEEEERHNKNLEDKEFYLNNYENKRRENDNKYNEYFYNRLDFYNQWKMSKNVGDLHKLVSLERPQLNDIPDIYTKEIIRNKNFKN
jgi:hypothetical protein